MKKQATAVADETRKRSEGRAGVKRRLGFWCALLGMLCAGGLPAGAQVTNFVLASTPQVGPYPVSVAAADLNGDGKLDLVSACMGYGKGILTVLTNDGSNVFGLNARLYWGGYGPRSVTVADVNGDGKPDLIAADTFDDNLEVLTNNGSGVFGTNATLEIGSSLQPQSVTVADVNGDGKLDLISVNGGGVTPETLMIFTNNGSGVFGSNATLNVNATSGVIFPINVVAADVNGDGKPDLIYPCPLAGTAEIWTNNGSGIFGSNATFSVGGAPTWVAAADINDDGKPDIICANLGSLTILTNNGDGVFGSNAALSVVFAVFVAVGDVNGDGKPDLICASPGAGYPGGGMPSPAHGDDTLTIFTNDGSGGFVLDGKLPAGGAPCSVAVADVNDDGQVDLICPRMSGLTNTLDIFTNTIVPGHTGFRLTSSPGVGAYPASVAVADVNLDGKPDLISANSQDSTLTVLTNNGSGWFGSNATLSVGNIPACVVSADVNGDGKPDLISGNYIDGSLTILTNNGSGGFGSNATVNASPWLSPYPNPVGVYSIAAADINGDGKPDLIRANYNALTLTVFTNNGSGVFGSNATLLAYGRPGEVVVADVNGDGMPDLISANNYETVGGLPPSTASIVVFTNNEAGSFGASTPQFVIGPSSFLVAVADINDDGKPDLVTADANDSLLRVWTNNGSGLFGSNATLSVAGTPASVALEDVNRDGKPDVICASYGPSILGYPGYLTIFTNNGSGVFGLNATLNVGSYPFDVKAADLNGDGRLDLVTANFDANDLSVLLNVPYLDMGVQTNGENLVWPYPSSGYVLQQNADLGTSNWVNITNTVNFVGGQNQVTLPPPAGNDFFRLRHP